jgi:hypothetical protein
MARRSTDALAIAQPDFGALIAERAYFRAEKRGFVPGHELEDWLAAEREIAMLEQTVSPKATSVRAAASTPSTKTASRRKTGSTVKKIK